MALFGSIAKFFGIITVKERQNITTVSGVDGLIMASWISKIWQTDKINKALFKSITTTGFSFNSFYIPDLHYILERIKEHPQSTWSARNTIDKIIHGFQTNTWYKSTVAEIPSMIDLKRIRLLKWKPLDHQMKLLHAYGDLMPRYGLNGYIIAYLPGQGKALSLDSSILTTDGFKPMREMTVGRMLVMPDGSHAPITGVYPQGELDLYRVTFEDGRWVDCCDDHLWEVYCKNWIHTGTTKKVVTLRDLKQHMSLVSNKGRMYVRLPEPDVKPDVDLPLDPYVLGALIGDGSLSTPRSVYFSTADEFMVSEINRSLPDDMELVHAAGYDYRIVRKDRDDQNGVRSNNTVITILKSLDMKGCASNSKFIPVEYMNASASQKLALLQGLMDTDGTVGKTGELAYCTVSVALAHQVQRLVRSLGGLCKIATRHPTYTHNGEKRDGQLAFVLNIRMKDPRSLFRLPRKRERLGETNQYSQHLKLRIKTIEYVGKKEAQCISVGHPDKLFITNDYIVTHNTIASLFVACAVIPPSIAEVKIIISPKKAVHLVWEKTLQSAFKKTPTFWCADEGTPMPTGKCEYYIFNYEKLDKATELAKTLKGKNVRYFVIVDESHNFADFRSQRTQDLVKLQTIRNDTFFVWLSGTPILKHAAELVSYLRCADPRFDNDAELTFRKIYTNAPGRANEIVNHRLGKMMVATSAKVAPTQWKTIVKELPIKIPKQFSDRYLMSSVREEMKAFIVERLKFYDKEMGTMRGIVNAGFKHHEQQLMTRQARQRFSMYVKMVKILTLNPDRMMTTEMAFTRNYERKYLLPTLSAKDRKSFRNALSAVKTIKLKVRGEALGKILAKRRSECTAALAYYCKPQEIMKNSLSKTLFFSSSVLPIKVLYAHLEKEGFKPLMVYGPNNANLTKMMDAFEKDPMVNPVCATMKSLSEAVPVTAASTVVLLDRPYRQAAWEQIIARADRLGQVYPVTVIETVLDTGGEPNVSTSNDSILADVRILINDIMGVDYAGPDPSEREFHNAVDASTEDPSVLNLDDYMSA